MRIVFIFIFAAFNKECGIYVVQQSAQDFIDGYRIFYNYVRPHTGLPEQQIPAEAAKIDLNLNPQNRLKDLIAKSAAQKEICGAPWK